MVSVHDSPAERFTVDGALVHFLIHQVRHAAQFERPSERPETAQCLRIQTPHVIGPASSSVRGRPATLRASFI
jgi:hypothetical protein